MPPFFNPTPQELAALEELVDDNVPEAQRLLVEHDKLLPRPDRPAHQQQIAGSKVLLQVAPQLPEELRGLGVFDTQTANQYLGIGRISTGLGCPHVETDPDLLGIMLAFRTAQGRRIDFIGINNPSSPGNTVEELVALLLANADAAGTEVPLGNIAGFDLGNLTVSQMKLLYSMIKHLGAGRALATYAHIVAQASQTLLSSTAYQQYWTGIVRADETLGKFTLVPVEDVNTPRGLAPGDKFLSEDWKRRQSEGDLTFRLYWIPFLNEEQTPLDKLIKGWVETQRVEVGTVVFPKIDANTREAKLVAVLASEMGGNPGHWVQSRDEGAQPELPATEFTAGRFFAYRKSQDGRNALPESLYNTFFTTGEIGPELAAELIRRYEDKRAAGHAQPDLGEIAALHT